MNMELESKIKEALKSIDSFKTPECLDDTAIGLYAEGKVAETQKEAVEAHLHACLYCLKHLNDMTELLHYQKKRVSLSPGMKSKLKTLLPGQNSPDQSNHVGEFFQRIKDYLVITPQQWRFTAIGLATAWMVFIVSTVVLRNDKNVHISAPRINPNSVVMISAKNSAGKVLHQQRGMIVSTDGYIEGNLQPLIGATTITVTMRDGRTREIKQIWKDDDANLAVMKIDDNELSTIPLTDIANIKIGQKIFAVPDDDDEEASEAIVCDFKQTQGERKGTATQYIQVSTQNSTKQTGKLIDKEGNLVGFLITEEENINFASPANKFSQLVKSSKAIPVAELTQTSFSSEALNLYMKGILARDAQRTDEAIANFQKATQLNPRLVGARIELGLLYYKKHLFDKEAEEYRQVLKIQPLNVDALYNLAWNLDSHGKYPEATVMYEKALALDPEDTETLYQLGLSYLAQGNKSKATIMYGRLKKLDPGNAEMLRRLIR